MAHSNGTGQGEWLRALQEMARHAANALQVRQVTVTTAESCTGGMIASSLTACPGISRWFVAGYVPYSNEAKQRDLNVPAAVLQSSGAVSRTAAESMLVGARKRANADCALVTTGIAGPDGGSERKPVGLVFVGCLTPGHPDPAVAELYLKGSREQIRINASLTALRMLADALLSEMSEPH